MGEAEQVERLCADGRCFVELACQYPDLPTDAAGKRIRARLSEARDAVFAVAEQARDSLAEQYRESRDPHKHLRQRPVRASLVFSVKEEGRAYRITWHFRLSRGGRALAEKENTARFDKQSGRILPK